MTDVKPIPERFNTVSVYLFVPNGAEALDFYAKAFGAETLCHMPGPNGQGTMHAEMRIGNSTMMLSDDNEQLNLKSPKSAGAGTASVHLYVEDVDAAFERATVAGCEVLMPPADMFWGDRFTKVVDPYGHQWGIATHTEDVPPEEMEQRAAEFFANMPQP
jgi:uncharacterized glyoxalase superfamily protein PhnB